MLTLSNGYSLQIGSGGTKPNHETLMVLCPDGPIIRRKQLSRIDRNRRDKTIVEVTSWAITLMAPIKYSNLVSYCDPILL